MHRRTGLHALAMVCASALAGVASAALAVDALAVPIATADGGTHPTAPPEAGEAMNITVTGTIEAARRDATGKATAVQIADANGGRFLIANEGKGKELVGHIGESATVTGRVVSQGPGKILEVKAYRLVEG